MDGPWQNYASPAAPAGGPWEKYQPPAAPPPEPTPATQGPWGGAIDLASNIATGAEKGVAALIGLPQTLGEFVHSAAPGNEDVIGMSPGWAAPLPGKPDPYNPKMLVSPNEAQSFMVRHGGPNYVPRTAAGRLTQSIAAGAVAGIPGGGLGALAGGLGGAGQQGAAELGLPEWAQTAAGLAAPLLTMAGGAGLRAAIRPTTKLTQMATAQKMLDEAAVNPGAAIGKPPIPRAPSTLGQATNDAGTLAFEKGRFASSPGMVAKYGEIKGRANQAAVDELQSVGAWPNRGEAVPQMQDSGLNMGAYVEKAQREARAAEGAAWDKVDPTNVLLTPTAPIRSAFEGVQKNLGPSREDLLPVYVGDVLDKWGPNVTLNEVKNLRSRVLNDIRAAKTGAQPDYNRANALGGVEQALRDTMDGITSKDPATQAALDAARQASREYHAVYDQPQVKAALKGPASSAGDKFMRSGLPEDFDAYYKATKGAPEATQAGRDYFMGGLARASESAGAEGQSLLASPYKRFLDKNRALLSDDRLFTPDQRDVINRAGDQLDYALRTQRAGMAGTSPTYQLFSSEKFAEAFLGKKGAAVIKLLGKGKGALGALIGGHIAGPLGAAGGAMIGEAGRAVPYANAGEAIMKIVDRALSDPKFASDLRAFRQTPNAKTLTPSLQVFLGVSGQQQLPKP